MFEGYFIKIGNNNDFSRLIEQGSYDAQLQISDVDSGQDGNGELVRTTLPHKRYTISFETPGKTISSTRVAPLLQAIKSAYHKGYEDQRKFTMKFFVPELDDYVEANVYWAKPQLPINRQTGNKLTYKKIKFDFVSY